MRSSARTRSSAASRMAMLLSPEKERTLRPKKMLGLDIPMGSEGQPLRLRTSEKFDEGDVAQTLVCLPRPDSSGRSFTATANKTSLADESKNSRSAAYNGKRKLTKGRI